MPVALGWAVKAADVRVKNPVEAHLVLVLLLLLRVAASVPLLNRTLLLSEGRADAVGASTPPSPARDGVAVGALAPSSPAPEGVAAGGVAVYI